MPNGNGSPEFNRMLTDQERQVLAHLESPEASAQGVAEMNNLSLNEWKDIEAQFKYDQAHNPNLPQITFVDGADGPTGLTLVDGDGPHTANPVDRPPSDRPNQLQPGQPAH